MAESGVINSEMLKAASDAYVKQFLQDQDLPSSVEHLTIQLKLAFTEGALWYNQKKLNEAEVRLEKATKKLEGLLR